MVEILRITYYLYEFKRTKQGEVPIYCKLTTDGINRQQFSTRLYIRPEIWDKDAQCVRGTSEDAVLINRIHLLRCKNSERYSPTWSDISRIYIRVRTFRYAVWIIFS